MILKWEHEGLDLKTNCPWISELTSFKSLMSKNTPQRTKKKIRLPKSLHFLWPFNNPVKRLIMVHTHAQTVYVSFARGALASCLHWEKTTAQTIQSYLRSDLRDQQPEILAPVQSSRLISASDDSLLPSSVQNNSPDWSLEFVSCLNFHSITSMLCVLGQQSKLISPCCCPCVLCSLRLRVSPTLRGSL